MNSTSESPTQNTDLRIMDNVEVAITPEVAAEASVYFRGLLDRFGRTSKVSLSDGGPASALGEDINPTKVRFAEAYDKNAQHYFISSRDMMSPDGRQDPGVITASISSSLLSDRTEHESGPLERFTMHRDGKVTYERRKNSDDPDLKATPEESFEKFLSKYKQDGEKQLTLRSRVVSYVSRVATGTFFRQG